MQPQHIRLEFQQSAAVLTMAHPERRNALSLQMMKDLTALFRQVGAMSSVHAVILAAEGKVFSSGHDLNELRSPSLDAAREIFQVCAGLMETVQQIPQPVIAEIPGLATAAGCQLAATCDLAVASQDAAFATPGVKIGLFCSTPMVALTRSIGRKRAMEMLLTGRVVPAAEALQWGLVNAVVPAPDLRAATLSLAAQIASASGATVATGKQAFYAQIDLDQHAAYEYASEVMARNSQSEDSREGICAFLQKREPAWIGR